MNQAEEDALVNDYLDQWSSGRTALISLFRLAIRAAYAQGREDAAKVCIKWGEDQVVKWDHDDEMREYNKSRAWDALQCAAAIRRDE